MAKRDYYEVLGIEKSASADEIKSAYRRLVKKYHPDMNRENPKEAEEKFKEVSEAYEVLAEPDKRARYDRFGHEAMSQNFGPGGFTMNDFTHYGDIEDLLGDFFGGTIFDSFFGGGRQRRGPQKGRDVRYDMVLTLEEAAEGVTKTLDLPLESSCGACKGTGAKDGTAMSVCQGCGGSGQVRSARNSGFGQFVTITTCRSCGGAGRTVKERCPKCRGGGRVRENVSLEVSVPKGIDDGTRLRLTGRGEPGQAGARPGDLYVVLHIKEHERFARDGDDLHTTVRLTFSQLALGAEVEVPTLGGGKALVKVPSGTQVGTTLRLGGKGMPDMRSGRRGDLLITVGIDIPKKLTSEQKRILREFEGSEGKGGLFG